MQNTKMNENLLNALIGNNISQGLTDLKVQLVLVQSACLLTLEGTTRATASQIAARAFQSYKVDVAASLTGQTFSNLNIDSVTTHGKNKFVLNAEQLETIRQDLETRCNESLEKLQVAIEKFQDLPEKIEVLQKEWKKALALRVKEQELIRLINEDRKNPPRLDYLEAEYGKIRQRNEYINKVQKAARSLALKEKRLPSLKERIKVLETKIAEYEKKKKTLAERERDLAIKEQETTQREAALAGKIEKLQKRLGWLELATLQEEIELAKKELNSLSKQLKEKRSLLDIFRRNRGNR